MLDLNVPAIEKLVDYTASGIGAIAGPMLAPWRASRVGKARVIAAKADAEVRHLEAESDARSLQIIADAQAQARQAIAKPIESEHSMAEITRDNITQRIEFQERKRLANVRSVIEDAAIELGDKEVPDHEPDPDWTARFFDSVQDVSAEEMQKIWSKILAGEVETPGRTSLRTLSVLRDMSQKDAKMFSETMRYKIGNFIHYESYIFSSNLTRGKHKYDSFGFLPESFVVIQDLGLLRGTYDPSPQLILNDDGITITTNCNQILVIEGSSGRKIELQDTFTMALTSPAIELSTFCEVKPDFKYLACFAERLKRQNCTLKIASKVITPAGDIAFNPKELRIVEPAS